LIAEDSQQLSPLLSFLVQPPPQVFDLVSKLSAFTVALGVLGG
jgi:hypothetical protein